MAEHLLIIETPEGEEIEIAISELACLSDSRAQMPDLKKIAKALGLAEDANEETIVAKITDRVEVRGLDPSKIAEALQIEATDEETILSRSVRSRRAQRPTPPRERGLGAVRIARVVEEVVLILGLRLQEPPGRADLSHGLARPVA